MINTLESNALKKAEDAVNELYEFRDTFVEVHGIECSHKRNEKVEAKLKDTLNQLDQLQLSIDNKAIFFYLRGKALNITPEYDPHAEECLSKAVKLDPNLIEAWNQLGENYWKKNDVEAASNCFSGAVAKKKNKISLRHLSMAQRQLGKDYNEKVTSIRTSVNTAKEAVAMDLEDGESWFVLGNAYLSVFFYGGQNIAMLKQCMSAYARADKDKKTLNNPDLHYNRATAYKYQEDFTEAIDGYHRAYLLDPTWKEAKEEYDDLVKRLKLSYEYIQHKGNLKPKKIKNLLNQMKESDFGPYVSGEYTSPSNEKIKLKRVQIEDLSLDRNDNTVICGKVVAVIPVKEEVPFPFILIDRNGGCIAVSVFNLGKGKGMLVGDSIAIPEPFVQNNEISVGNEKFEFRSIRVDNPVVMVVNKHKVGPERLGYSVLAVTNKFE